MAATLAVKDSVKPKEEGGGGGAAAATTRAEEEEEGGGGGFNVISTGFLVGGTASPRCCCCSGGTVEKGDCFTISRAVLDMAVAILSMAAPMAPLLMRKEISCDWRKGGAAAGADDEVG